LIIPLILNWQLNCIKKDEEEKMNAVKIGNYPRQEAWIVSNAKFKKRTSREK
jgi:hypothetical protein